MIRRPPRSTRTDTLFPYTTLFRSKELLIGEAADPALIDTIRRIVEAHPEISAINHVRTIHTAPASIFVSVSADFEDELLMGPAEALIETIEGEIKAASPLFSSIRSEERRVGKECVSTGSSRWSH